MRAITWYLHLHQPYRFVKYSFFDVGQNKPYWGDGDREIFLKVADKSYLPTLDMLERSIANRLRAPGSIRLRLGRPN